MRVVAGSARGRPLRVPPGRAVRPTTDRARESMFNSLTSLGLVRGAVVLDLFAGSGALGIEALSRGAHHVTFVDRSAAALRSVRENLERTGLGDGATVVRADALEHLGRAPAVDLLLADPPYDFADWPALFAAAPATHVVAESDREVDPGEDWVVLRSRRLGGTVVTIAARQDRDDHGRPTPEDRT